MIDLRLFEGNIDYVHSEETYGVEDNDQNVEKVIYGLFCYIFQQLDELMKFDGISGGVHGLRRTLMSDCVYLQKRKLYDRAGEFSLMSFGRGVDTLSPRLRISITIPDFVSPALGAPLMNCVSIYSALSSNGHMSLSCSLVNGSKEVVEILNDEIAGFRIKILEFMYEYLKEHYIQNITFEFPPRLR